MKLFFADEQEIEPGRSDRLRLMATVWVCVCVMVAWPAWSQGLSDTVDSRVRRATVMVRTAQSQSTEGDTPIGFGTGFFVNRTGLCVTNDHVIDPGHGKSPAEKMRIWLEMNRLTYRVVVNSGMENEKEYRGDLLYSNDQADMAVLQVYEQQSKFLETPDYLAFYPSENVEPKTVLWNFGFPGGDSRRSSPDSHPKVAVQVGNVVELPRSPSGRIKAIVTNILANQGNSGGPAVDAGGRLVGIATLAGGGDTGRAAVTLLIPADLTKEMIRITLEQGRVPRGIDVFPFLDSMLDHHLRYRLPELERNAANTCMKMRRSGSLLCGDPVGKTIAWSSPLGPIEVPLAATAYMVRQMDDDKGAVLLDGGNRLLIDPDSGSISFVIGGGDPFQVELRDVESIAFPLPGEPPEVPKGEVLLIGGDEYSVALRDVEGTVAFETSDKIPLTLALPAIARIASSETSETKLHARNGSIMTGRFRPHELSGVLAWTGTPIKFSLQRVSSAVLRTIDYASVLRQGEPPLTVSLTTTDSRFKKMASALDDYDVARAQAELDELLKPEMQRSFTKGKKEELRRLEGEFLFRSGKFDESQEVFKRLTRSEVEDVRWHAQARVAMLARYPGGAFEGGSLADPDVFREAAVELATSDIQRARRSLEELERAAEQGLGGSPVDRNEYNKLVRQARETEDSLLVANRLRGGTTEGLIVRLWRNVSTLHVSEVARLEEERRTFQERERGSSSSGQRANVMERQREQKMTRFERDIENAAQSAEELLGRIVEAGFIIDDTDLDISDKG